MTPKGHLLRLRCGGSERERFYLQCPERLRVSFSSRMTAMARSLVAAGKLVEAQLILRKAALQTTEIAFSKIEELCRKTCAESPLPKSQPKTFRDVAELWMNGTLCRRYPDDGYCLHGKRLAKVRTICKRLDPLIGGVLLGSITKEMVLDAKAQSTVDVGQGTRRQYALVIRKVIDIAVDPLGLIDKSPVPKKFVPTKGEPPGFSFLYPDEDRALLAYVEIPVLDRLLYGFIDRTGLRIDEALGLTGSSIDLPRGAITVVGKGGKERFFKLEPDVVKALSLFFGGKLPSGPLFPEIEQGHIAGRFRKQLEPLLGERRPELFVSTPTRRALRIHDLRATAVTLWLAMGKSEQWIMDRTGHSDSSMLQKYNRPARHAGELDLGPLHPLDECLGLVKTRAATVQVSPRRTTSIRPRVGQRVGQNGTIAYDLAGSGSTPGTQQAPPGTAQAEISAEKRSPKRREMQGGPRDFVGVGQNADQQTPSPDEDNDMSGDVEQELVRTLRKATDAGEWQVAQSCVTELTERRRARAGSTVVDLDSKRSKR